MKKEYGIVALVLIVLMLGAGLPIFNWLFTGYAPAGYHVLVYQGGPFDGNNFVKYIKPGKGRFLTGGILEKTYKYPAMQRSYIISKKANEGDDKNSDELILTAKDSNRLHMESATYFRLIPKSEIIRQFHEKHGLKYGAWQDEGWSQLLTEMFRQPIHGSAQEAVKPYLPVEASGQIGFSKISSNMSSVLQRRVDAAMGGKYFEITSFELKSLLPDNEILTAVRKVTESEQRINSARNENLAADEIAAKNNKIRESLSGPGGMETILREKNVSVMVVPYGTPLTLPTK